MAGVTARWVPLWVESNYTFLTGASHPEELVRTALNLGLPGLAITDRDSLAGVVQARDAWRDYAGEHVQEPGGDHDHQKHAGERPFSLIVGAKITVDTASSVLLLAIDRKGYGNLGELISLGQMRSPKGECSVTPGEIRDAAPGLILIITEETREPEKLRSAFSGRTWVGISRHFRPEEEVIERRLLSYARRHTLPPVALPRVLYHDTSRRHLHDVLRCIDRGVRLDEAGDLLLPNGSYGLLPSRTIVRRYADHPEWIAETERIAGMITFTLDQLEYRYPEASGSAELGESELLRRRVRAGAARRYPEGVPPAVSRQLESELNLIEELQYGGYFLTMAEIVEYCRSEGILCQGRGSAANSAVCFCLGITAVDPVQAQLLFERFISRERAEPPDIDLDIEHRRREEVIQYVYSRYGRNYAAMVANTVRFRKRSAVREAGKVFGFSEVNLDQLAKQLGHHGYAVDEALGVAGFDTADPLVGRFLEVVDAIIDTPRHLSIHPGGFLLGRDPIARIVPIENATMEDRTVIQWDKYAVESMNLFKLDLLGLGALTHLDYAFRLMADHLGISMEMAMIPRDCPRTFAMLRRAETVGVFQLESRAQMAMLPRMLPREFYDLVIEISIVRPGPITGGMVHPYLRRRHGDEEIIYPHRDLQPVLERTLGVPLFQEQVMKLAIVAADYTPGEADRLRRDMAAWRSRGRIEHHHERIVERMVAKGIERPFAEQVFEQIRGFGEYGFPESHAASFALIAYSTAWVRAHYPVIFFCSLLNAWPMGFYSPSTIVHDAQRVGVEVRPVDFFRSDWECTLEVRDPGEGFPGGRRERTGRPSGGGTPEGRVSRDAGFAIRLGFRFIKGLGREDHRRIETVRRRWSSRGRPIQTGELPGIFRDLGIDRDRAIRIVEAGVFDAQGIPRRDAVWVAMERRSSLGRTVDAPRSGGGGRLAGTARSIAPVLVNERPREPTFRHLDAFERIAWDYRAGGHSTAAHPLEPYREWLSERGYPTATNVRDAEHDDRISYIGMVICRQRPSTASGTVFMTLEDETGFVNLIIWKKRYEEMRPVLLTASFLGVRGAIQNSDGVVHLIVESVWHPELPRRPVTPGSRDFH
ncbi:MAG: error-prone DNA polymerase [Alkalispirochaeta sp.]